MNKVQVEDINKLYLPLICLAFSLLFSSAYAQSQGIDCDNKLDCSFVLLTPKNELVVHNHQRASKRFTPYSTFKIPNSLIALDTGVVNDLTQLFTADTTLYPPESWWPQNWTNTAHNLTSAYKYSVVPLYRKFAADIGFKAMQNYLQEFDYGNKDISSGLDSFWLNGSVQISAIEQVYFLEKLFTQRLPLNTSTYRHTKKLMHYKQTSNATIYAKTGTGPIATAQYIGWLVGCIEKNGTYYYFAINTAGKTFNEVNKRRLAIAKHYFSQYQITAF